MRGGIESIQAETVAPRATAQKPVIDSRGVMNAATLVPWSVLPVITPGEGAAEGSIATIFGQNLAPTIAYAGQVPLPISLAGVSVVAAGGPQTAGISLPLFLRVTRSDQFSVP